MKDVLKLIGNTPIVKLNKITDKNSATIWVKLENLNPTGSIKDRIAHSVIDFQERKGVISPATTTIVEATSGNTGISLAFVSLIKGYKLKLFIPKEMSDEKKDILRAFNAEIIEVGTKEGIKGVLQEAKNFVAEDKSRFLVGQFTDKNISTIHSLTTASELISQVPGKIDAFVAGVGTGGTITGVGKRLKEVYPTVKIYAVEPEESPTLSEGKVGKHGIEGIGVGFIPDILDTSIYDDIIRISTTDAIEFTNEIIKKEGIMAGISSGATCLAARKIAKELGPGHNVATICFDTGERYLNTDLFGKSG